jgi:hypothetical protein
MRATDSDMKSALLMLLFATTTTAFLCKQTVLTQTALLQRSFRFSTQLKMASKFYDLVETDADGQQIKFDKFKGQVVYGVNVASKCGYTASGYALMSKVTKMPGVEVAIFPCNQFGGQEPGSDTDVANFCVSKGNSNSM